MTLDPVTALAAAMGVKRSTVRQWIARDKIRLLPGGGFDPDTLERWIDQRDTRRIRRELRAAA